MNIHLRKKISHIFTFLFIFIVIVFFTLHFFIKKNSSEILKSYLTGLLNKKGDIYKIEHNHVDIDFFGRQIIMRNLKVTFDEEQLKNSGIHKNMLFKGTIPFLSITGVSYLDFILFRKIKAERIFLKNGDLKIYLLSDHLEKKKDPRKLNNSPSISLGRITMEDTNVELFTQLNPLPQSGLKRVSVDAENILFAPEKLLAENFRKKIPGVIINAGSSFHIFKKTGYKAETGQITLDSSKRSISIKKFKYAPESIKTRKTIMFRRGSFHRFNITGIEMKNIDMNELIKNKRLHSNLLHLIKPEIFISRNRNVIRKKRVSDKKLPQQIFRESGFKVALDIIRIKNGAIKYSEVASGEKRAESIFFTGLESSMRDISNFPEVLKTGKESEISVSAKLMGKSTLKGKIVIPINNKNNKFSFSGSLQKTNPEIFSNYLNRNARIRIKSGKLRYMEFTVNADEEKASGKMKLYYQNLKVSLLRKKDPARKSRFKTFLANTFIHRNNPTKKDKKVRTGKIIYKRKVKRSIFNYMWKCILAGIKTSIRV